MHYHYYILDGIVLLFMTPSQMNLVVLEILLTSLTLAPEPVVAHPLFHLRLENLEIWFDYWRLAVRLILILIT